VIFKHSDWLVHSSVSCRLTPPLPVSHRGWIEDNFNVYTHLCFKSYLYKSYRYFDWCAFRYIHLIKCVRERVIFPNFRGLKNHVFLKSSWFVFISFFFLYSNSRITVNLLPSSGIELLTDDTFSSTKFLLNFVSSERQSLSLTRPGTHPAYCQLASTTT
jgi:hypothetical protein